MSGMEKFALAQMVWVVYHGLLAQARGDSATWFSLALLVAMMVFIFAGKH